jgi:hypothetical protein
MMKKHFDALIQTAKDTGAKLKEKAAETGMTTVDNVVAAIEKWLVEFPKIESYGLRVMNFSFVMSLSPSLEVELLGNQKDFPPEKLDQIIEENKAGSLTGMIFKAVRTAYKLHRKIAEKPDEILIIKIRLSFSPEISVYIGKPEIS